ncbi:MAG TPA: GAF domain-containing SpoIIE family protein phosphatase [Thermoleophilaceae bacterium]
MSVDEARNDMRQPGWSERLERRVLSAVIRRDDAGLLDAGVLQRLLGSLFIVGATIGMLSMVFPQPPGTSVAGLFAIYGIAYSIGAFLLLGHGRLPVWSSEVALVLGTGLVTLAIHFTNTRTGVYAMFYVWVSIVACYFLGWGRALLQIGVVSVLFAAVLADEGPPSPGEEWVITLGTVLVAGLLVGLLRRGVERLIDDLNEAARTDHARLYAAERAARLEADRATESLRRLQTVTDVALNHLQLDDLLDELLARVTEVLGVDAALFLQRERDDMLVPRATKGLEGALELGLRIPMGAGFAGRVAAARRPLVLEDISETESVNPFLLERGVRALMGAPLIAEGQIVGVLHVASFSERQFTEEEERLLGLVADRAALAIEHARVYEREHEIAETLQRSLLPPTLPTIPGVSVAGRYLPARAEAQVGGDWYDVVQLTNGGLALTIGDVSGHGIEAAAMMGRLRDALRAAALEGDGAAHATQRVDVLLQNQRPAADSMATAIYMVLSADGSHVDFSCAGHPPPLLVRPDGSTEYVEGGRSTPLGVPNGSRPVADVELEPGALLLLYTDGLVERRDAGIDTGLERLARAAAAAGRDPERFCDAVVAEMLAGGGPDDDVALLAVATSDPST